MIKAPTLIKYVITMEQPRNIRTSIRSTNARHYCKSERPCRHHDPCYVLFATKDWDFRSASQAPTHVLDCDDEQ